MLRKLMIAGIALGFASSISALDTHTAATAKLSAAEIAGKNVAARGGLQAWRAVQSLSESGQLGAGGNRRAPVPVEVPGAKHGSKQPLPSSPRLKEEAKLPFVLELERPRKVRLEIQFKGQTAVQVYDGANGWKLRPFLNRSDVEPFTSDELKLASMESELDGPVVDYAAKGTAVELAGVEKVEGRDDYKLKLTMKDGHSIHVWIDSETFLETKIEGQPRRLDGKMHPVEVYYRDYHEVNGLKIPFVLETHVLPVAGETAKGPQANFPPETITVEKVVVNPKLDAALFGKPTANATTASR